MTNGEPAPLRGQIAYWEERIREQPLTALGLAALAGFAFGGALRTRAGWVLLGFAGRMAAKEAAANFLRDLIAEERVPRHPRQTAPAESAASFD